MEPRGRVSPQEEEQTDVFLHVWLEQFKSEWIFVKTLVEQIEKATDEDETPAKRLAETLPDELAFKLKDKPKTFSLAFSKWLERRLKTPYGSDHIRIEREFNKHEKQYLWRVCAGVSSASSMENAANSQSQEPKQEHADNTAVEMGGDDTSRHPPEERGR
jgi:hypothetical protein